MDVALLDSLKNVPEEIWLLARILLIAVLTWIVLRLIRRVTRQLIDRKLLTGRGEIAFRGISRVLVLLIAGLFMLEQLGVSTGTVWAAVSAVLVMIAVGFVAVWSVLSNALCSMLLLIYAPFRVGDDVELVDPANGFKLAGRVIDLNLLFVTLRETVTGPDGEHEDVTLRLPNNLFFQRAIRSRPGRSTVPLTDAGGLATVTSKKSA
ncbi:mechanosensitive ion channel domain-containing protein [uncultured Abyssibacter sp.]|uniref:mechanosensitive ion channel domain-containing protein n=1 Tax=uncultured Abyssibacter sp. TaxID=2320202 RepID=UPI0032B1A59C